MDGIDGTDHYEKTAHIVPPALLTVVIDTNPHAWNLLAPALPLFSAVASILVFVNAHIAGNSANKVAIIASHCQRTQWLYPTPTDSEATAFADIDATSGDIEEKTNAIHDANKYRPFRTVEDEVMRNLRRLIATTTASDLRSTNTTMMAGALTLALNYSNRVLLSTAAAANASAPTSTNAFEPGTSTTHTSNQQSRSTLQARILIVSVSGDLAAQYIPIMNTIFASQRLQIPIDILKLAGDTVFLQQASDATDGIYLAPSTPQGLLQYLMLGFLHDQSSRKHLVLPKAENVDFRAACFCHRKIVDIGFVCSICLSIFCEPTPQGICLTCGTQLTLGNYGSVPILIAKKKKKKKRAVGDARTADGGTPGPS